MMSFLTFMKEPKESKETLSNMGNPNIAENFLFNLNNFGI